MDATRMPLPLATVLCASMHYSEFRRSKCSAPNAKPLVWSGAKPKHGTRSTHSDPSTLLQLYTVSRMAGEHGNAWGGPNRFARDTSETLILLGA